VRGHCRLLMQARLVRQTGEDEFALSGRASA
jgi:hypothetical protein